jgi:hypothetical protein
MLLKHDLGEAIMSLFPSVLLHVLLHSSFDKLDIVLKICQSLPFIKIETSLTTQKGCKVWLALEA